MDKLKIKGSNSFWIRTIDRMLEDDQYEFSKDYLVSVKRYVESHGTISQKQKDGIMNIKRSTK